MSQINTLASPIERTTPSAPFRFPNPLRAGLMSFAATIVLIGAGAALLNVAADRGLDAYYNKQLAALAEPSDDAAYKTAQAMAAEDATSTPGVATVSIN